MLKWRGMVGLIPNKVLSYYPKNPFSQPGPGPLYRPPKRDGVRRGWIYKGRSIAPTIKTLPPHTNRYEGGGKSKS